MPSSSSTHRKPQWGLAGFSVSTDSSSKCTHACLIWLPGSGAASRGSLQGAAHLCSCPKPAGARSIIWQRYEPLAPLLGSEVGFHQARHLHGLHCHYCHSKQAAVLQMGPQPPDEQTQINDTALPGSLKPRLTLHQTGPLLTGSCRFIEDMPLKLRTAAKLALPVVLRCWCLEETARWAGYCPA